MAANSICIQHHWRRSQDGIVSTASILSNQCLFLASGPGVHGDPVGGSSLRGESGGQPQAEHPDHPHRVLLHHSRRAATRVWEGQPGQNIPAGHQGEVLQTHEQEVSLSGHPSNLLICLLGSQSPSRCCWRPLQPKTCPVWSLATAASLLTPTSTSFPGRMTRSTKFQLKKVHRGSRMQSRLLWERRRFSLNKSASEWGRIHQTSQFSRAFLSSSLFLGWKSHRGSLKHSALL